MLSLSASRITPTELVVVQQAHQSHLLSSLCAACKVSISEIAAQLLEAAISKLSIAQATGVISDSVDVHRQI